jgi:recombination protein RecT
MTDQKNNQLTTPLQLFKKTVNSESVQAQFANALGESKNLFTASLIELYTNTSLSNCSPNEVICEALKAAVLKLPLSKSLGLAWIVPRKGKPVFQIGYIGYIQLAIRSGQYETINADVVYKGEYLKKDKLSGVYDLSGQKESDEIIGYFAYLKLKNGFFKSLYSTKEEIIEHAKKFSPSYFAKNSVWKSDFDAMAKKTLISALLRKWGILSIDIQTALESDSDDQYSESDNENTNDKKTLDITSMQDGNNSESEREEEQDEEQPGF